jgi:type I restriction enzyme M protein
VRELKASTWIDILNRNKNAALINTFQTENPLNIDDLPTGNPKAYIFAAQTIVIREGFISAMPKRHTNRVGDLESMFLRLEELVLANSGEDEFEEVFKLVIAKLWDERKGGPCRFRTYSEPSETYQAITTLLREAERAWPGIVEPFCTPALTPEHLQVCVDALAKHTILDSGLEVMDSFFEFMVSRTAKGSKGQYFTPRYVVEFCVRMLQPSKTETVLDPACGSGGFLVQTLNYVKEKGKLSKSDVRDYCATKLWGFDMDSRAVRVAKALMVLSGDGQANIIRLNSLLKTEGQQSLLSNETTSPVLTVEDICRSRLRKHKGFDVILTNPPFAGEVRENHILENYTLALEKPKVERDILFVERCVQLLRPGGRMAIILPHNKVAADSFSKMREWLLRRTRILAVVGLGRHTFLPHTHQKASIVFAQKREEKDGLLRDSSIFFAVSERDGKNSKGQMIVKPDKDVDESLWERVDHDLSEVLERFNGFCRSEGLTMGV